MESNRILELGKDACGANVSAGDDGSGERFGAFRSQLVADQLQRVAGLAKTHMCLGQPACVARIHSLSLLHL